MAEVKIDSKMFRFITIAAGFILLLCYFLPWVNGPGVSYSGYDLSGSVFSSGMQDFDRYIPSVIMMFGLFVMILSALGALSNDMERLTVVIVHELILVAIVLSFVFFTWGIFSGSVYSSSVGPIVSLTVCIVAYIFASIHAVAVLKKYEIYT